MIYEKDLETKKCTYKRIVIDDFSGGNDNTTNPEMLKYKKAVSLYNFMVKNGRLELGYGVQTVKLPASITASNCTLNPTFNNEYDYQGIWLYKYYDKTAQKDSYDLIIYASNGQMYWLGVFDNNPNVFELYDITLTSKPNVINYRMYDRDYLLICNETEGMISWDGVSIPKTVASAPNIRSVCRHGSRLFALTSDRYYIRYSSEIDPTNWLVTETDESSGYIRLSDQMGGMNKIVSFLGYLYVFRDNGITKIKFFEEDNTYEVSQVFFAGSRIYPDSIAIAEDEIYFTTRDGVYSFDGMDAKKINLNLDSLYVNQTFENSVGVFHKGTYFLACYLYYNDNASVGDDKGAFSTYTVVNNVLIGLDTKTKKFDLMRGIDVVSMLPIDVGRISKLLLLLRGPNDNKIFELTHDAQYNGALSKQWKTDFYSLGDPQKRKILKSYTIYTKYEVEIEVFSSNGSAYSYVYGKDYPQTFKCNLLGDSFSVRVRSLDTNADVRLVALEVAEYDK